MKNGDVPIKHGDFPIKNGDFPMKNGDFPVRYVNVYQDRLLPLCPTNPA